MKLYVLIKDPPVKEQAYHDAANEIMNEIRKFEPYKSVLHTEGSNVIEIDVRWKSNEIIPNLRSLQTLENVKGFLTIHDPLADLDKATAEHDFFKAYSLGCTYFESMGMKILNKHFDSSEVHIGKDISGRLQLQAIIVMLYTNKLISADTYNDMTRIVRIRNTHLIHGDITERPSFEMLEKILEPIDKIPYCARKLNTKFNEMNV